MNRAAFRVLASIALFFALASVALAANFILTKTSETNGSVSFLYPKQAGADGYRYYAPGQVNGDKCSGTLLSRTLDPNKTTVKFAKVPSGEYCVEAVVLTPIGAGQYPTQPAGDTQPPTAPSSLTANSVSQTSVSLAWGDATDNVKVTNYRVYRGTTLIGQGPGSSGGFANAWTDGGRTCNTTYSYAVEAQDAAGNTGPQRTLSVTTMSCDPPVTTQCSDGIDNDGDGKIDYPNDPGCLSATDTDEADGAPPPATTLTPAQLESRCTSSFVVIDNVTVNGSGPGTTSVSCPGNSVTIQNSRLSNLTLDLDQNTGFRFISSSITTGRINCWGSDNGLIQNSTLDGGGSTSATSNQFWDIPAGNGCQTWTIKDNTIKDFRGPDCATHGEGLNIGGYSRDFLIEGNTFTNNGCTSHIFFTYFGGQGAGGYQSAQVPRNVCVRGNIFGPRFLNTYFDVNFRDEVVSLGPAATNIRIQPGSATTNPEFNAVC